MTRLEKAQYHEIVHRDNWGHNTYYLDDGLPRSNGYVDDYGNANLKRCQKSLLKHGQFLEVLFKDGTTMKVTVRMTPYHTSVSDHGHSYDVSTHVMHLVLKVDGKSVVLDEPLENLRAKWVTR